jgi:hypothetical protein
VDLCIAQRLLLSAPHLTARNHSNGRNNNTPNTTPRCNDFLCAFDFDFSRTTGRLGGRLCLIRCFTNTTTALYGARDTPLTLPTVVPIPIWAFYSPANYHHAPYIIVSTTLRTSTILQRRWASPFLYTRTRIRERSTTVALLFFFSFALPLRMRSRIGEWLSFSYNQFCSAGRDENHLRGREQLCLYISLCSVGTSRGEDNLSVYISKIPQGNSTGCA